MPARNPYPHTNVQLTEEEIAALQAEAAERGVSRSQVVDDAVRHFLGDEASLAAGVVRRSLDARPTRLCGFVLSAETRALLQDAKRRHRFAKVEVVRAALAPFVRRRDGG